jgi:SAM-dependent methyltransferase
MKQKIRSWLGGRVSPETYSHAVDLMTSVRSFLPSLWFRGRRFTCPLCGGRFRKFRPIGVDRPLFREKMIVGGGYRANGRCPRCGGSDRERLVYLYLKQETALFRQPARLLHVAPERSLQRVFSRQAGIDYTSADIDSPRAAQRLDITAIGHDSGSFDAIICCHVLEHVMDDRRALAELYRVLRPGGWAILQVPFSRRLDETLEDPLLKTPAERETCYGQHDHQRLYGRDFPSRLAQAGFQVRIFNYARERGTEAADRFGLCREEDLFIGRKR